MPTATRGNYSRHRSTVNPIESREIITMSTTDALHEAKQLLEQWALSDVQISGHHMNVIIEADKLKNAVAALMRSNWGYLSTITGNDRDDYLEVLYHFCTGASILTLRVQLSRNYPAVPSLCDLIPSAILQERELQEMFGITVSDIPDNSHLLLPDDWPDEIYPLRKDAVLPELPEGSDKQ
jgi:Ni,Fe-hydrogenase III component G